MNLSLIAPDGTRLADMEAQYRQRVIELFEMLTFRGMSDSGSPIVLPLEAVYVELKAVADVPEAADTYSADERRLLIEADQRGMDARELARQMDTLRVERWRKAARQRSDVMERRSIHETLNDRTQRGLVILGDPGSGKTTLLHYLALQAARGKEMAGKVRVPIFVPLAAYDDYITRSKNEMALLDFMSVYYAQWHNLPGLAPLFEQALQAGQALLLFDGLDEVMTSRARQQVANQVSGLMQQWRRAGNCFVMTSRIVGYREITPPRGLSHVTVLDFGRRERGLFAKQWYLAFVRSMREGQPSWLIEQEAQNATQTLLAELNRDASIKRLAANPLLLSMLALLRHQTGKLPERRIRLYDRYMALLLTTRQESRSAGARKEPISHLIESDVAEEYLIELAFWLQQHKPSGTASREALRQAMTEICLRYEGYDKEKSAPRKARIQARQQADDFVDNLRYFAGMLAERGRDAFGFLHLTFQEYYVGRALARLDADERWQTIQAKLHHPRWHEAILLCAGRLGQLDKHGLAVDDLLSMILDANSPHEAILHRDLFLATAIIADNVSLFPARRRQLTTRLLPLQTSPIPIVRDRALAALAQLARLGDQKALNALKQGLAQPILHLHVIKAVKGMLEDEVGEPLRLLIRAKLEHFDWPVREAAVQALAGLIAKDRQIRGALIAKLDDPEWDVSEAALQALAGLIGEDREIRVALIAKLDHPSFSLGRVAVQALAGLIAEDREIRTAIIAKLDDPEWDVREAAMQALAKLIAEDNEANNAQIRAALIAKLDDSNPNVRRTAVEALAGLLTEDREDREIRDAIIAKLDDSHPWVRHPAVFALARLLTEDREVRAAIIDKFDDSNNDVRKATVQALAGLITDDSEANDAEIRAAIIAKLDDSMANVRRAAVQALAPLIAEDGKIRAMIIAKLDDPEGYVRQAAVQALVGLIAEDREANDRQIRATIIAKLDDSDYLVRQAAVETLAALIAEDRQANDTEIRAALIAKLDDPHSWVRRVAMQALVGLVTNELSLATIFLQRMNNATLYVFWQTESSRVNLLARLIANDREANDTEIRAALIAKLDHSDNDVRKMAVQAFAGLIAEDRQANDREANHALIRAALIAKLDDSDNDVRKAAAQALARLIAEDREANDRQANHALIRDIITAKLDDPEWHVRQAAVQALAGLIAEDPQIKVAITAKLDDSDEWVRQAAVQALAGLIAEDRKANNGQIRAAIIAKLDDSHEDVRHAAVSALAKLIAEDREDREIRVAIIAKLDDSHEDVRYAAVSALAKLIAEDREDREIRAAIIAKLDDSDDWVREAALSALAGLLAKDREDLEIRVAIIAKLDDSDDWIREAALSALAGLLAKDHEDREANDREANDAEIRDAIIAKLDDPFDNVRQAAVQALIGQEREGLLRKAIYALLAHRNELPEIICLAVEKVVEEASLRKALLAEPQDLWEANRPLAMQVLTEFVAQGDHAIERFVPWLGFIIEPRYEGHKEDKGLETRCLLAKAFAPHLANNVALYKKVVALLDAQSWAARHGATLALLAMPDGPPAALLPKLRSVPNDRRGEESWFERLQHAERFINHRNPDLSRQAIATALKALDFATQPWYVMPRLGRKVRKQAAQILGQLEPLYYDDKIFARLVRVLEEDEEAQVRDAAFAALERLAAAPNG